MTLPDHIPTHTGIRRDFFQDKFKQSLTESLETYFKSATLFDIETELRRWIKMGWVVDEGLAKGAVRAMLEEEVRRYFERQEITPKNTVAGMVYHRAGRAGCQLQQLAR